MHMAQSLSEQGNWLFRWRSYVPLLFLPLLLIAIVECRVESATGYSAVASLIVSALGNIFRCLCVACVPAGTSGRNTSRQIASGLNTTGAYSITRNPLYVGNYVVGLGVCLATTSVWLVLTYTFAFCLYYERIVIAEEVFLEKRFGNEFRTWASQTPAFFPRIGNWCVPALPLSFRSMIRREYSTLMLTATMHFSVHSVANAFRGNLGLDLAAYSFGCATLLYVLTRATKKHTKALDVAGR